MFKEISSASITMIVIYFLILLFFLLIKTPNFNAPYWFLIRSLFPNWKFFDQYGYLPRLYFRFRGHPRNKLQEDEADLAEEKFTAWLPAHPALNWRWDQIFHNPEVNLALAQQSTCQQMINELSDFDGLDIEKTVPYEIIRNLVQNKIRAKLPPKMNLEEMERVQFQFVIRAESFDFVNQKAVVEDLLLSPIYYGLDLRV